MGSKTLSSGYRSSRTIACAPPSSRTIACAPPSFEHTLAMTVRPISRPSIPTFVIEARQSSLQDELAARLTWLAYAVALGAFGVVLGVGLGLLLAPSAHLAVRI